MAHYITDIFLPCGRCSLVKQQLAGCLQDRVSLLLAVCELGCSSVAVTRSCRVRTFFSSESLTVSDNVLKLWIKPSSFREDDKVHLEDKRVEWMVFNIWSLHR